MRDDFSTKTKEILAKRAGYKCSNPSCKRPTSGPQLGGEGTINIGEAAHICAASEGGPRYDPLMTQEERCGLENGIWLCSTCAGLIDRDENYYTKELLNKWKLVAEHNAISDVVAFNAQKDALDDHDLNAIRFVIESLEGSRQKYMLVEHDFHEDYKRSYMDSIYGIITFFENPSNGIHDLGLRTEVSSLINEIKELRLYMALKGGRTDYSGEYFKIDFEEDVNTANILCTNVWDKYKELIQYANSRFSNI